MKILQLGKAFPPIKELGGVEKVMEYFYYGLNESGIDCDVLGANDKNENKTDNYCKKGLILRAALLFKAKSTFFSISLICKLWKVQSNYDVLHIHLPDPMALLAVYLTRPKSKIIIHWHSNILKQKYSYLLVKYFENWLLKRSDEILCTSPNYYLNNNVLEPYRNKTSWLAIGLDKKEILFNEVIFNEIKTNKSEYKKIIYVGRFVYYKGLEYLIRAMPLLKSNSILYLIGSGALEDNMKDLVEQLNLSDKVIFLGEVDDKDKFAYIKASDVLVLPSIYKTEAYGIVQVEAMALGVPVISTRIEGSGVDWVNQDRVSGLTIVPENSVELARGLDEMLLNNDLHKDLSKGAELRFENLLTKKIMIDSLILKYQNLIAK